MHNHKPNTKEEARRQRRALIRLAASFGPNRENPVMREPIEPPAPDEEEAK